MRQRASLWLDFCKAGSGGWFLLWKGRDMSKSYSENLKTQTTKPAIRQRPEVPQYEPSHISAVIDTVLDIVGKQVNRR